VLALVALHTTNAAAAEPVKPALAWRAERPCIEQLPLTQAVESRLGRRTFVPLTQAEIVVNGRVIRRPDGWEAHLELSDRAGTPLGTRVISSPAKSCRALDESLALVLALMVDLPRDELERRRQAAAPASEEKPAAPTWRSTPIALPAPARNARRWRVEPRVEAAAALGAVPGLALGLSAGALIEPPAFGALDVDAAAWLPTSAGEGDRGSRFQMLTATTLLCPLRVGAPTLALHVCAGQRVGALAVRGFGFDENRSEMRLLYDIGVRARAAVRVLDELRLTGAVGAEAPLLRDRFFFTRPDGSRTELFRQSSVVATVQLGVAVSLR
jgi:hypothetical protein